VRQHQARGLRAARGWRAARREVRFVRRAAVPVANRLEGPKWGMDVVQGMRRKIVVVVVEK
jgi:hypothetical protein